jgi:Carbohydrate esterase, sialic acid-specific acetylesterase/Secretion system C-terminal sorting domain
MNSDKQPFFKYPTNNEGILMKKFIAILFALSIVTCVFAVDSLLVEGKILFEGTGKANINIAGVKTDANGGFSVKIPAGIDTTLVPNYYYFVFDPPSYHIASTVTSVDSLLFTCERQAKKVIIISGQSNAENVGEPKYFISDTADQHIPYYLAYSMGDYGLSTLGLLTKFGKSYSYCKEYNCGFGLEMLLARTLYKHYSDSLAVIKLAYSGTALYDVWQPNGSTWSWFTEKHDRAVTSMRNKGLEPEYVGVFWFQGESDEFADYAPDYAENLYEMVDRMRARFPNSSPLPELPFICVEISWDPASPYEPPIQQAQRNIAKHRDYTACINIDDCRSLRYSNRNMHFSGSALNRIGYKLATQYLEMIGTPVDSTVTVSVDMDEMYNFETSIVLSCEGDITFMHEMTGLTYDFDAKLGDELFITLRVDPDYYTFTPASYSIPFLYDPTVLKDKTFTFNVDKLVEISDYPDELDYAVINCYPNPFNPQTSINFQIPTAGDVKLHIVDLSGKEIRTLIDMSMEKGAYRIEWDASSYPSGMYVARLDVGSEVLFQKLTLLK